jgi:ankyrin repeat protein
MVSTPATCPEDDNDDDRVVAGTSLLIPPGAIRPIIDQYIESWFGRGLQEFNSQNRTPLMEAAEDGDEASVFMVLMHYWASGINNDDDLEHQKSRSMYVNLRAPGLGEGHSALHLAAIQPNSSVLRLLLEERGIEIEIRDEEGLTPLHWAAAYGFWTSVEMLIGKGANIDAESEANSLLCWVPPACHSRAFHKSTPLHAALRNEHEMIAHYLIEKGANVQQENGHGRDAKFEAASHGCVSIMKLLLEQGADPNDYADGDTLVNHAAFHGYDSMVELLVQNGAHVHAQEKGKKSPLHIAASIGSDHMVNFLVQHGADIDAREDGAGADALLSAASGSCKVSTLQLFLDSGANIHSKLRGGYTSLHLAVAKANVPAVDYLIESGADVQTKDDDHRTPLHWACGPSSTEHHSEAIVFLLLERGADFRAKDRNNRTPLHDAAQNGWNSAVLMLLDKGAEVNVNDCTGRNPIQAAAQGINTGTFQIILQFLLGAHP